MEKEEYEAKVSESEVVKRKCTQCSKRRELVESSGLCWKCHVGSVGFGSIPGGARSAPGGGVAVEGEQFRYLG